jgi:hypothetical protein
LGPTPGRLVPANPLTGSRAFFERIFGGLPQKMRPNFFIRKSGLISLFGAGN